MHKRHPYTDANGFPPFPPDPVERVSDKDVAWYANPRNVPDENINNMAEELIERRKAEKEGK